MIKEIVTDTKELGCRCLPATPKEHEAIIKDLLDTAKHHKTKSDCVGLSANQIGHSKRIFVMLVDDEFIAIVNPSFVVRCGGMKADYEKCLSYPNRPREDTKIRRYKKVVIRCFSPAADKEIRLTFKGFQARVVQHEMDHLNGVLV